MQLIHGDCLDAMRAMPPDSVDAIVTDPPYGWRFMGKAWDGADIVDKAKRGPSSAQQKGDFQGPNRGIANKSSSAGEYNLSPTGNQAFQNFSEEWAFEASRVLKPGGHALVFCGPRTYHRMAAGVENAGFEIRDQLQWLFGSGFPKSHNLKEVAPGFGTALKPANEPILLARKPLSEKTVAANVLKWGTGGINIEECRIGTEQIRTDLMDRSAYHGNNFGNADALGKVKSIGMSEPRTGRFPANLLLDETAAAMLDEQSGNLQSDSGGASRFFYVAKSSKREKGDGNTHPTVKPIKLMRYLCRLITPPGGTVLDPFMGSGSTGIAARQEGFKFIGIEREAEYMAIAQARLKEENQ